MRALKSKNLLTVTLLSLILVTVFMARADSMNWDEVAQKFKKDNEQAFKSGKLNDLVGELKKAGTEISELDRFKLSVVYNSIAEKSMSRMRYEDAKTFLDESISTFADNNQTKLLYGRYCLATGDWPKALEWLEQSKIEKESEESLLLAKTFLLNGDHKQALEIYEYLKSVDTETTETQKLVTDFKANNKIKLGTSYKAFGRALLAEDKKQEAIVTYKKGIALLPASLKELNRDLLFFQDANVADQTEETKTRIAAMTKNKRAYKPVTIKAEAKKATGMLTAYSMNEAQELAKKNDRKVLLILSATWCGPCKLLKKNTLHDPQVEKSLEKYVMFIADVDQPEGKQLSSKYGTGSIPQSCIVDTGGNMLDRKGGYMEASPYSQWLDSI